MIVVYVAISITSLLIIRKYYPHQKCKPHNDIAGFIFATLGVIYAVLLAFIVVITWQDFDKAQDITINEAN
jgi:purine-cytosine permease-like protein